MRRRIDRTQRERVKQKLLAGERLNHLTLIADCGGKAGWRLGAVIHALANDPIDPLPISRTYSGTRRMATYWIEQRDKKQRSLPL